VSLNTLIVTLLAQGAGEAAASRQIPQQLMAPAVSELAGGKS
jgi:hypothetical protein